jgi:hypothetical protein
VLTAAQTAGELVEQLTALGLEVPPVTAEGLDEASALPVGYPTDFYQRHREREATRHHSQKI